EAGELAHQVIETAGNIAQIEGAVRPSPTNASGRGNCIGWSIGLRMGGCRRRLNFLRMDLSRSNPIQQEQ
ncbi:MAG: hypothetical protein ACXU9H_03295, partial [Candidatus Binataceae bacterium]